MGGPKLIPGRRLIVNADDFGRSPSINEAVIRAHSEGILTTASLMVNEPACAEAIALAHANPNLGVGLHLALLCGRSALAPSAIPGLVDRDGRFSEDPVSAGMRFFFVRELRDQLHREIAAQVERFHASGLPLDHVNGHLHIHLHPTVLSILTTNAKAWGIRRLRFTRDPFILNAGLAGRNWLYRASHAFIYRWLSGRARRPLRQLGVCHTSRVFGLLQNARVDEAYVARLLPRLPAGDSELYSHPSTTDSRHELDALVSPRIKALITTENIQLIRYQDL